MTNFEMDLFDTRVYRREDKNEEEHCCRNSIIKPACLPITILALLILMTFFIPMLNEDFRDAAMSSTKKYERTGVCTDQCSLQLVESIPTGMTYPATAPRHKSTYNAWSELLKIAEKSLDIVAVYWNLRDRTGYKTSWQGEEIFDQIVSSARRGVKLRVAHNSPGQFGPLDDLDYLEKEGLASAQILNFTEIFGSGILHTKLWVVDNQHFYLGSANMDWQSLTEVKEMGLLLLNCSCLAWELTKIFSVYWRVGQDHNRLPPVWPVYLRTKFNAKHPLQIHFGSEPAQTFISHSPAAMNPRGRDHDLAAITRLMDEAEQFIRIAVMDYVPATLYMPAGNNTFWPPIDDAMRAAAFRGVQVELLVSQWPHSKREAVAYLRSLLQINSALPVTAEGKRGGISIKFFRVPVSPEQKKLPFARVNHNKYMVTEKAAWVGTSNWSGDYFISTAGIGMIIEKVLASGTVVDQLNDVFDRDWTSAYAFPLTLASPAAKSHERNTGKNNA